MRVYAPRGARAAAADQASGGRAGHQPGRRAAAAGSGRSHAANSSADGRERADAPAPAAGSCVDEMRRLQRGDRSCKPMEFKDYYATLGVAKTATEKEIKQAFRKLARKHHPDVNPGDKAAEASSRRSTRPTRCSAIPTSARSTTSSARTGGCTSRPGAQAGADPFGGGFNVGGSGARGGFRTMTPGRDGGAVRRLRTPSPISSRRSSAAARGGRRCRGGGGRVRQRPGRDVENEIELSLEDAYTARRGGWR